MVNHILYKSNALLIFSSHFRWWLWIFWDS